jgi:hypothetical protein
LLLEREAVGRIAEDDDMSSDTTEPSGSPGTRGRRWPGPTIELEATEIKNGGRSTDFGLRFVTPFLSWLSAQKERLLAWWAARTPPDPPWRLIGAVAAGVLLVVLLVFLTGQFSGDETRIRTIEARIARAEQQVRELSGRAPPNGVDSKALDELSARVTKLEAGGSATRPPAADPALANRMATLEGTLKSLEEKIGVVARRTDDIDLIARDAREKAQATAAAIAELTQKMARLSSTSDLDASVNRIAALERLVGTVQAELAKRGLGEAGDRPVRLAVTASALNTAVERGDAFAAELSAARQLAGDAAALAPLESFAATGLPSATALGRELVALTNALAQTSGAPPREGGFLDRLQANAERLVRIRPLDEPPGDDPAAVLTRIEQRALQADLPGALTELAKLPAPARAAAQAWIAKAQARLAAVAASRRFAADAFAALGKTPEAR